MSAVAAGEETAPTLARTRADRIAAALPLAAAFACLTALYAWQAWLQESPWLFVDELHYARLGRAIAGGEFSFETLYAAMTAPAWLIDDTPAAYAAAKYVGVLSMTSVLFPAYLLARTIVSRPFAVFAAIGSATIPVLSYSSLLMQETLAYPYATWCLFLITRALATRGRRWIAAAVATALLAPLVRGELIVVPAAFALAAALAAWTSEGARRRRARWGRRQWLAAAAAAIVLLWVGHLVASGLSEEWATASEHPGRMLEYGTWALAALAIGLGILPVIAALSALRTQPAAAPAATQRAFVSVFLASLVGFTLYTAAKAAYLAPTFGRLIEERNVIYLAPLLFAGTAAWLARLDARLPELALATAGAAYLVLALPYTFNSYPTADAPSIAMLSLAALDLRWSETTIKSALLAVTAVSALIVLLPRLLARHRPRLRAAFLIVPALVVAWNLAGELAASDASTEFSERLRRTQPQPLDWVDRVTGGARTAYVGQQIAQPSDVWLLAFWNRSVTTLHSLDETPAPSAIVQTGLATARGALAIGRDVRYVVAERGIDVAGRVVAKKARWRLIAIAPPFRLRAAQTGVYGDGWMSGESSYSRFSTRGGEVGFVKIRLSRKGWCGTAPPARVTITVGTLAVRGDGRLGIARPTAVRPWIARSCTEEEFVLRSPAPPFRVEVHATPTFVPAELDPTETDRRPLGVQVAYGFTTKPPPPPVVLP